MRLGRSLVLSLISLLAAATVPGACGTDGIVGGACRSKLTNCNNHCVNLNSDENNCGRCGNRCATGVQCVTGHCGDVGDGGWGGDDGFAGSGNHRRDGGVSGTGVDAGTDHDAFGEFDVVYPNGGGGNTTANGGSGNTAGGSTAETCVPPYDTASSCGSCHRVCVYPNRVCAPVEGAFDCVPLCNEPLVECNGACVDLNSDSDNCGACGRICPSAICQGGQCIGAQAGHIVIIGMNYREASPNSQATNLLANSVLLPRFNPVKILAYDEFAEPSVSASVNATIGWASLMIGRAHQITTISSPQSVNTQLKKPDFDTFLLYEQSLAPSGTLANYGTQWAKALESFSFVGGVIVVLSGSTGTKEMPQFLTSARLLEVTAEQVVSRAQLYNRQPADAIGVNVVSPFLAPWDSCVFSTPAPIDSSTVFVVTDEAAPGLEQRPVVVHRIAIPKVD